MNVQFRNFPRKKFMSIFKYLSNLLLGIKFWIIITTIIFGPFWLANITTFAINSDLNILQKNQVKTLLVLGAQVNQNNPGQVLTFRLNRAFELFETGQFDKILLSGGQREPIIMTNYLTKKGIPKENLFEEWGGLRTIDSCWRAKNVFKISKVAVVTQSFHLARAVAICQTLGMEVWPIIAKDSLFGTVTYGLFREVFACWDSLIDILRGYKPPIQSDGLEPDLS